METYYTVEEVANMLRVTKTTVYRWIYDEKLKAVKFTSNVRIPITELNTFLSRKEK